MAAAVPLSARRLPGQQPPRLPLPPRRREEFAASSKLAGAGSRIAGRNVSVEASALTPRRRRITQESARNVSAQQNQAPTSASTTYSNLVNPTPDAAEPVVFGEENGQTDNVGLKGEDVQNAMPRVDALELARGGESLLRRLGDLHSANADLRRQLELQVNEVATLEDAGRSQQKLLREFERQAELARQKDTQAIEARVRAEFADQETKLQTALEDANEKARAEHEELLNRLQDSEGRRRHAEGERDEVRERVRELESRLEAAANAPEAQETRSKALEMELNLVKSRFAREVEAKTAAERASAESRTQQQELKVRLEKEAAQVRQLQQALAEQTELAVFRQEVCNDLQMRLRDQKSEAEHKLRREKGKLEAVSRLEGILPKSMLLQALA